MRKWYMFSRHWCRFYFNLFHFGRAYNRRFVPADGPVFSSATIRVFRSGDRRLRPGPRGGLHGPRHAVPESGFPPADRFAERVSGQTRGGGPGRHQRDASAAQGPAGPFCCFPEATRTTDGRICEFKPGLALLARKAKAPVVPVVIDGAYEAWPRSSPVPRQFVPIHVIYGRPLLPEEVSQVLAGRIRRDDPSANDRDAKCNPDAGRQAAV